MRSRWWGLVVATISLGAGCLDAGQQEPEQTGSSRQAASVTWTNAVRVTAVGSDLTKNDPGGRWNAGAVSVEELTGDGFVEFTTGEANTTKMCGLGNGDAGQGFADIEFGIRLKASGGIAVYESGTQRGSGFGTYAAGDLFRVQAEDGVVTYRKNGVVFYTSAVAPSFPLRVDTSLLTDGATINDVALTPTSITWQNVVGVSIAGPVLTKTSANGWNAGASSVELLAGDGFVEFTSGESNTRKMAGLSNGDSDQSYTDIDHAIDLRASGVVAVYEAGVVRGSFGSYAAGDVFRVEVTGGVVRYSKNGGPPFYTSSVPASGPLGIDTSFNTTGATLRDFALTDAADACPVYDGGGTVCGGSFTVANDFDLAAIAGCAAITGNLTITAPGLTTVALRNLERVGGNLVVMGNTTLVKLLLAQLKEVGGMLRLELASSTTEVDLSRLRSSGRLVSGMAPAALRMSCLTTVGGDINVLMLVAPNLTSIGGVLWFVAGMDFPLLEQAGGILVGSGFGLPWTSPDISLPSLHTVTGIFATAVRYLGFDDTEGTHVFNCRDDSPGPYTLSVPALERVGSLTVCHLPENGLDLSLLRSVTGPPTPIENERDKPGILIRNPADTSTEITLPVLEDVVGTLELSLPAHLPALTRSGPLSVRNTIDAPVLQEIKGRATIRLVTDLPSLNRIDGSLDIRGFFTAPALQEVTRNLTYVGGSLTADELTTVGGALLIKKTVTAVSLPALMSVDSIRVANSNDNSLQTLSLPSLTTVTGADGTFYSGLLELSGTRMTTLSLPALSTVAGDFRLSRNHVLTTFDIPLLTSVGPSLTITSNEDLPNCYATDLLAQLQAAGWSGTSTISGNGTGTCP